MDIIISGSVSDGCNEGERWMEPTKEFQLGISSATDTRGWLNMYSEICFRI